MHDVGPDGGVEDRVFHGSGDGDIIVVHHILEVGIPGFGDGDTLSVGLMNGILRPVLGGLFSGGTLRVGVARYGLCGGVRGNGADVIFVAFKLIFGRLALLLGLCGGNKASLVIAGAVRLGLRLRLLRRLLIRPDLLFEGIGATFRVTLAFDRLVDAVLG